jgi:hypothetical protein
MEQRAKTRVVHCRRAPFDVYIGRDMPSLGLHDQGWGNPFRLGPGMDRDQAIDAYLEWLVAQPELVARARRELAGLTLGCWCAPRRCHGEVLAQLANGEWLPEHPPAETWVRGDGEIR